MHAYGQTLRATYVHPCSSGHACADHMERREKRSWLGCVLAHAGMRARRDEHGSSGSTLLPELGGAREGRRWPRGATGGEGAHIWGW